MGQQKEVTKMKKVITGCFLAAALTVPTYVMAQDTASGTLTVTGTVVSVDGGWAASRSA